ncbi:hypothetical protein KSP40_PGU006518 [Platanthera guangdongensis]|uniref:Uncharacterized protein n=1 Tax=Platanthera guangdongensis TaxID=2320717 RepID=A0ABR2LF18_9ASPA
MEAHKITTERRMDAFIQILDDHMLECKNHVTKGKEKQSKLKVAAHLQGLCSKLYYNQGLKKQCSADTSQHMQNNLEDLFLYFEYMKYRPVVALRAMVVGGIAAFAKVAGAVKVAGGVKVGAATAAMTAAATAAISGMKDEPLPPTEK